MRFFPQKAPDLFRKVLLASASIPGAFEPQYLQVIAGGKTYEEIHVDGGTTSQVFLWGAGVDLAGLAKRAGIERPNRPVRLLPGLMGVQAGRVSGSSRGSDRRTAYRRSTGRIHGTPFEFPGIFRGCI